MPATFRDRRHKSDFALFAANGSSIATYGKRLLTIDLGLRRLLQWPFVLAEVKRPIIGSDFLSHFNLLPDMRNRRLVDGVTLLNIPANLSALQPTQVSSISKDFRYQDLLTKFPGVVRESITPKQTMHQIEHVIETTSPPIYAKARRLPPDKLRAVKEEFDFMVRQGLCRPSKSPWATPLHLVGKKNNDWRPCGDYRRLNEVTIPDRYPVPFLHDCTHFLHGKFFFNDRFGPGVSTDTDQGL